MLFILLSNSSIMDQDKPSCRVNLFYSRHASGETSYGLDYDVAAVVDTGH